MTFAKLLKSLPLALWIGFSVSLPGAVFDEILTVQATNGVAQRPATGNISIPYSRVDVGIQNGIAATRFLQTYHNHGASNEGFAVQQPLQRDTTITGFTLWDQGQRYVGAIEERATAELAYKEVTGDEAPTMNRDPGLVRRTRNNYEYRVFPILPGEDKQIELISHERLGMEAGRLVCRIPLATLARPREIASHTTDFTISITDQLPVRAVNLQGVILTETILDEHQRRYQGRLNAEQLQDAVVTIELAIPGDSSLNTLTFSHGGEDYFSTRWFARRPARAAVKPAATNLTGRTFYMGVWREDLVRVSDRDDEVFGNMGLEILAFLTAQMLDLGDEFHGSYQPPRFSGSIKKRDAMFSQPAATAQKFPVRQFDRAYEAAFAPARGSNTPPVDVWKHLAEALKPGDCSLVYLFLQGFTAESYSRLAGHIRQNPSVEFVLISSDEPPPAVLQEKRVSYFHLARGWLRTSPALPLIDRQVLLSSDGMLDELSGFGGLDSGVFQQFWSRLPNAGATLPALRQTGQARLSDVRIWRPASAGGDWELIWLSGRFNGAGQMRLELTEQTKELFGRSQSAVAAQPLLGETALAAGNSGNRFVATFYGRQLTDALDVKIARLWGARRGVNRKELFAARQEIARLSKKFGFISAETAFIALPPDLMAKYGFTPQEYAAHQIYNPATPPVLTTPEPETWMLLVLGLAALGFVIRRRRREQMLRIGLK